MWQLPPLPDWDGLHPLVIHFPIVLTLIAPLFVILAVPRWRHRWAMAGLALAITVVASAAAWVAVSTGEAAGELATRTDAINRVLETHERLAEFTAWSVTSIAVAMVVLVAVVAAVHRARRIAWLVGCLVILVAQAGAILAVVNTAHNGGRLVHEFGIHALLPAEPLPSVTAAAAGADADQD